MRIAYLCADPGIPVLGDKGASIHVRQIVRAFVRRGDEVTIYCTRRDGAPGDEASAPARATEHGLDGVRIVEVPVPRVPAAERERAVATAAAELARLAAEDGCDLVYERYALFSDASARLSEASGVPSIVEVNAPLIDEQRTYRTLVDEATARRATARVLARATVVAAVSAPVAAWAEEHGAARAVVAPNGVDTAAFSSATHASAGPLRACFVGSLKPWHGVDVAIDAMAGLGGVELTVVGEGPERPALEARARRRGADVRFTGAVPSGDVPRILAGMHAGLAPYPPHAGEYFSPLKVYEYLAAGVAVVASRAGQVPSIVTDGATGLLVAPGDAAELRAALARLRDDRALASRLGASGRATALGRHDWSVVLDGILSRLPEAVRA
ncbi:glycosyltransferase family 4 protein [Microbacterium marinilacus]|uniref:D-inositol 3-phosphate glycosyltransferase n=1 Tax=Microbacterium marinilacus TaxID=415209 RepID=A0ABP7B9D4_9MICO|nr:glycosyltransferase family 4 protein [Microbacterium marinilacus]MBY0687150.1 glycosyltransferase family 4 protein [Microbacterium marinilacus]